MIWDAAMAWIGYNLLGPAIGLVMFLVGYFIYAMVVSKKSG